MIEVLFDQYQRYKKTQEIINELRNKEEKFNILEVGANEHKNLEKFLPSDKITYLDIQLDEEFQNDPQYILGDATQMNLEDNSYDFIVALDVFEHIPSERRKNFIDEINRVAKKGFILMGPFDTAGVADAERNINAFFKGLVGNDHPWLVEHIQNGLPNWKQTLEYLEEKNIKYTCLEHGSINIWENLMRYHFLSVYSSAVLAEVNVINQFYNEKVYPSDTEGRCYRKIIVGVKQGIQQLTQKEKAKQNDLAEFNLLEAEFYKKLCTAYANSEILELKDNHIHNLEQVIGIKESQVRELEQIMLLKDNHISNIEKNLQIKEKQIENIEEMLQLKDNHINNIEAIIKDKDVYIESIEVSIKEKEQHIRETEQVIKDKDNHIRNIEDIVRQDKKELQLKDNHIKNIESMVKQEKVEMQLKDNHIDNISIENKALINKIEDLQRTQDEYKKELDYVYSTLMGKVLKKLMNRKR